MGDTSDNLKTKIVNFYSYFVEESNNGNILTLDLSEQTDLGIRKDGDAGTIVLTDDEVNERREWKERKRRIQAHYRRHSSIHLFKKLTQEEFLTLRVAAPCLCTVAKRVSMRSPPSENRANRHYPQQLEVWGDFEKSVRNFYADDGEKQVTQDSIVDVEISLIDMGECETEADEVMYLKGKVLRPLEEAGLVGEVKIGSTGCQGNPDFIIGRPERKDKVMVKSTHNLPLPIKAEEVAAQYNAAREAVDQLTEPKADHHQRPLGWCHVGHPVSQILGYMVLNSCRYGVLTSGSRTHFILIQGDTATGEEKVCISDAWYIRQENYLRAWAFLYARARDDTQQDLDKNALSRAWLEGTPDKAKKKGSPSPSDKGPSNHRINSGGPRRGGGRNPDGSKSRCLDQENIPTVTLSDFEVGQPIGYGRRGTTFSGTWNGEIVALKLFDTDKNKGREAFDREMKAYEHLKEAWGRLVPTPKFIAEAFGVIYFGMQMAEHPPQSARHEDWDKVLWELEERYGFRHLDVDGDELGPNLRNHMILHDDSGRAQPIVIDLEQYEML